SGTYGFKEEYSEISRDIGSSLFELIDRSNPEIVITDCVTCKWQIENFTSYKVFHPVNILAMAIE
ncbi:anaerobic glycerol-3-phosphate dehydrogenase subunit C, partial [Spirochaetota bacterium]